MYKQGWVALVIGFASPSFYVSCNSIISIGIFEDRNHTSSTSLHIIAYESDAFWQQQLPFLAWHVRLLPFSRLSPGYSGVIY
ncbi:hypothetical protein BDF20DRAFT_850856 [Mycotypha africana]|uniref:uncharacterized protein n=1 Tax=Mycotypha africana TaxID=64632 RepID=UPI0023019082|nr:uncharacterized protein BDF20DRAFT_850856 [Mycotypha africana]KAI8987551.1 hypothetical protein BDF20DRAFT_850856 [Mycotypha africana]